MDTGELVSMPQTITGMKSGISKPRVAAISGFDPYTTHRPCLKKPMKVHRLSVIELDIKVTTADHRETWPLQHDPKTSIIIISNGVGTIKT